MNEYPHMLYKDGTVGDDWRIVADVDEEAEAATNGYLRVGAKPKADDEPGKRRGAKPKAD